MNKRLFGYVVNAVLIIVVSWLGIFSVVASPFPISLYITSAQAHRSNIEYIIFLASGSVIPLGIVAYITWHLLSSKKNRGASIKKRGSWFLPLDVWYLFVMIALSAASWINSMIPFHSVAPVIIFNVLGALVFLCGLVIVIWARRTLGQFWSYGGPVITAQHKLVRKGPYQWVRHPIYAGQILWAVGFALWLTNWVVFLTFFGLVTAFNYYRARREDALLADEFGDEYDRYQQEVPMLMPLRGFPRRRS
jgi:protein-S-isoprenylcysteine O-methyltransferase Ste14